jgi:hypothetical protein
MSGCIGGVDKTLARNYDPLYFALQSSSVSSVTGLHKALAEIHSIHDALAREAEFRGYGPATLAATGSLALLAAELQAHWVKDPARQISVYLAIWIATAAVSLTIISIETVTRARRVHSGLAMEMICALAVSASHRRRVNAARGAGARRPAKSVDASGPVASAVQYGRICLVPISSTSYVCGGGVVARRGPGLRGLGRRRALILTVGDGHSIWHWPAVGRRRA